MRGVIVFISLVVILLIGALGGVIYIVMQAPPPAAPRVIVSPVTLSPAHIDFGVVSQCGEPLSAVARLTNDSDTPFHLGQLVVACGCTVPDLKVPLRLEPGQSHEFVITVDPWGMTGARTQRIDFIYAETERAPPLSISYETISLLRTTPGGGHRQADPSLIIRLSADDGEPFIIEGVDPKVVEPWIETPTPETHLTIDWSLVDDAARDHPEHFEFDDAGVWKRGVLTIKTTRADCPEVRFRLYNTNTSNVNPMLPAVAP